MYRLNSNISDYVRKYFLQNLFRLLTIWATDPQFTLLAIKPAYFRVCLAK